MARRKKRRKNPDGPGMKNLLFALAAGVGLYLIVRELQKRGMLGNGDYGQKPSAKPKPAPYKPSVVQTIAQAKTAIPKATSGPMYDVYSALKKVEMQEKMRPQAEAAISDATRRLQTMLVAHSRQVSQAKTPAARAMAQETMNADVTRMQDDIDAKKRALEASPFQQKLNDAYAEARAAARAALMQRESLKREYGEDQTKKALGYLQTALVEAGDEEVATSEGSVERAQ